MSRNFGWGSRDMVKAASFALKSAVEQKTLSFSSAATILSRFSQAAEFFRENNARYLEYINSDVVLSYAEYLKEQVAEGNMSVSTAQNYISAVNTVMDICTRGEWEVVRPVGDCEVGNRTAVRTDAAPRLAEARAIAERVESQVGPVGGMIVRLAAEFGLRAREASLLRPQSALTEAEKNGVMRVTAGTKGGRPREVPVVRQDQWLLLREAASMWGAKNAVEASGHTSWKAYLNSTLRSVREAMRGEGHRLHDLRASYACERYLALTSSPPPVWGGGGWRGAEAEALRELAEELGHTRTDILVSYLGRGK